MSKFIEDVDYVEVNHRQLETKDEGVIEVETEEIEHGVPLFSMRSSIFDGARMISVFDLR